jgi:hypothetical protein
MRIPNVLSLTGILLLGSLGPFVRPASPQGAAASASSIPRTADGTPDLSGFWQAMNTANYDIEAHSARAGVPAGLGVVEGGEIPYQAAARARRDENVRTRATADTESKCFLPGVPRIMYMPFPFQVVQTPKMVIMLFEYLHATRNVFMDTPHLEGPLQFWMGDSRGRWDGDTLVVDVVHFTDQTWFDRAGNYHSPALHVVEHYTMTDRDHISYTAQIEDPTLFTRPWTMSMVLYRHTEPNFRLLDYECYAFALDEVPVVPRGESAR